MVYTSYKSVKTVLISDLCHVYFTKFLKENHRLENELLENAAKLAEYESLTNKLQHNLENVLAEKVALPTSDFLMSCPKCHSPKRAEALPRTFLLGNCLDTYRKL